MVDQLLDTIGNFRLFLGPKYCIRQCNNCIGIFIGDNKEIAGVLECVTDSLFQMRNQLWSILAILFHQQKRPLKCHLLEFIRFEPVQRSLLKHIGYFTYLYNLQFVSYPKCMRVEVD